MILKQDMNSVVSITLMTVFSNQLVLRGNDQNYLLMCLNNLSDRLPNSYFCPQNSCRTSSIPVQTLFVIFFCSNIGKMLSGASLCLCLRLVKIIQSDRYLHFMHLVYSGTRCSVWIQISHFYLLITYRLRAGCCSKSPILTGNPKSLIYYPLSFTHLYL